MYIKSKVGGTPCISIKPFSRQCLHELGFLRDTLSSIHASKNFSNGKNLNCKLSINVQHTIFHILLEEEFNEKGRDLWPSKSTDSIISELVNEVLKLYQVPVIYPEMPRDTGNNQSHQSTSLQKKVVVP